jgi:vacuolar-type H+-ATPase subunit H
VKYLAENVIDRIRKAEQEADETIRAALEKASYIVEQAKKDAQASVRKHEDAAQAAAAEKVMAAQEKSKAALEEARRDLDTQMQELLQTARARQPEAVQKIMKALV